MLRKRTQWFSNKNESEFERGSVHHGQEEGVVEDVVDAVEADTASEGDDSPAMVQELESNLGEYWNHATVHSEVEGLMHQHIIGSVIQNYRNLGATLSTPQYGFQKGLKIFKEAGHDATIKELDKNLISKNVLNMLEPQSVTYDNENVTRISNVPEEEFKQEEKIKARGCADGRPQREYITKLELRSPTVKTHALFIR